MIHLEWYFEQKRSSKSVGFEALVEQWHMIGTFFNKFPERAGHNSFSLLSLTSLHLFNMFHKYIVRKRKSMTVLISVCSSVVEYLIRSCFFLRLFSDQILLIVVFVLIVDLVSLLFKLFRVVARAPFASVTLSLSLQQYNTIQQADWSRPTKIQQ